MGLFEEGMIGEGWEEVPEKRLEERGTEAEREGEGVF